MNIVFKIFLELFVIWNIVAFVIMAFDKYNAVKRKKRIRERTVFICAFIFGGIGILLGMYAFRHKTKHWKFKVLVPAAIVVNIVLGYVIFRIFS